MRFPTCLMSMSFLLAMTIIAAAQPAYNLPEDPDVPVLKVWDLFLAEGGDSPPLILVYADGRVVKQVSDNREDDYVITIEEERLQELLGKIIEGNQFFEMDVEVIKAEVLTERKLARLRPGFEFRIELNLADRAHVVSVGNSWVYQRLKRGHQARYKDASMFHQFLNVEVLCRKLSSWALVGGEESMQEILDSANREIQAAHPGSPKVTNASIASLKSTNGRVNMCLNAAAAKGNPALQVFVGKTKGEDEFDLEVKVAKKINIHGEGGGIARPKPRME